MAILHLFTDGASRGNPGKGAYGYQVLYNSERVAEHIELSKHVTNNQAEYLAMEAGLSACALLDPFCCVEAHSDSLLMISQLNGEYKVRDPMLALLHARIHNLVGRFNPKAIAFHHVSRETPGIVYVDARLNDELDEYEAVL